MVSIRLVVSLAILVIASVPFTVHAQDDLPRSTDPRLKVELYAENPQIVTPTGIDVDQQGRVWVIESNTHFPPDDYKGHPTDRVLVMEGRDDSGRVKKITVFKDGLVHSMSVAVKPAWLDIVATPGSAQIDSQEKKPLEIYIATRREILLCVDTDGDLVCDKTTQLVHLETAGNYPHNGLAGFAFDPLGNMYFGFGENLGADYKVIGSDGVTLSGGGEGGNIYRCKPDGSKLERWATGFWNPHASCFDAFGRMFTVDNDPDSRPPCRLLHIVEDGDYGYRFRNGRKGTHPFTAWNGELPGTLPMVSGTGEAPSGILSYESNGLPEDYVGTLLVGSWGDHRIDKFVLKPRGISFESMPQPVIKGGENFRPVGLAVAPDGSLFFSDWVSKEYKLHGLGRVWRVSMAGTARQRPAVASTKDLIKESDSGNVVELSNVLVDRRIQARTLSQSAEGRRVLKKMLNDNRSSEPSRIESLWALANVPLAVDQLKLGRDGQQPANFLKKIDHVSIAAAEILNSPQLAPKVPVSEEILPEKLLNLEEDWGRYFAAQVVEYLSRNTACFELTEFSTLKDPFINALVLKKQKQTFDSKLIKALPSLLECQPGRVRPEVVLSFLLARAMNPKDIETPRVGLLFKSLAVKRAVVQWIGEEQLKELRPDVEKVLSSEPMSGELFMACLATLSLLDGVPPSEFEKAPPAQLILPILKDHSKPAALRAIALRILPPSLKELDAPLMTELVGSPDAALQTEAVRTLAMSRLAERDQLLSTIAKDASKDAALRADAVAGLANPDQHAKLNPATRDLLTSLATNDKVLAIRLEAIRSLRGASSAKSADAARDPDILAALNQLRSGVNQAPKDSQERLVESLDFATGNIAARPSVESLQTMLKTTQVAELSSSKAELADRVAAGRRAFFQVNGAGCYKCHTIGGRGGQVGPDLTVIAQTMGPQKLAQSILEPSKEISPQFTSWVIETVTGKVFTGMLLGEEVNGDLRLGNNQGELFYIPFRDIANRSPLKTSVMPEKLHEMMTVSELQDLVLFLSTLR